MKNKNIYMLSLLAGLSLPAMAQYDVIDSVAFKNQKVDVGANKTFSREQSTAAVSIITNKDVNRRGARNIGNNIIGQGNGLVALDGSGLYSAANPTLYVRGLQSLNGSTPLIIVDGVERAIENVNSDDVENVTILKDAAATALYGYKGANGAIVITTKHGSYDSKEISFSYDHTFSYLNRMPKFVDAATYASAVNEAYRNQGGNTVYSDAVIDSYKKGDNPLYYPNVDWANETFRNISHNNKFNLQFRGGSKNFRYYTALDLITNSGFIKNPELNGEGYSTQDKYTRASVRSNMDIDLGPKTKLHTHLFGLLTEQSQPGSQANLWGMVYQVPSNAFPVKIEDKIWGGSTQYTTNNPVAQSAGAAFYKKHQRALYGDIQLEQDLSSILEGLSAQAQLGYDTWSNLYEDHSKTYTYGVYSVANYAGGKVDPASATLTTGGTDSNMGTGANNDAWIRRCIANASINYDKTFGKNALFAQLKYDYEFNDVTGTNTSVYRQNVSFFGHYGFDNRYLFDATLMYSGSNRLAPGSKWAFSPTVSAAWNISNEAFMKDVENVKFLKLRASAGLQQLDVLPDNNWTYYDQFYVFSSPAYGFDTDGGGDAFGSTAIALAKTQSLGREKSMKYNIGIDATFFDGLNVSLDYYYQHRYDIWCSTTGSYTSVFGLTAPYENIGVMNSHGVEIALDYQAQVTKNFALNLGATFNFMGNTIKEQGEEPRLYSYLNRTGHCYGQAFGYVCNGFFGLNDDLNGDGVISTDEMAALGLPAQTFTTVYPGDLKYADLNGDGKIDGNDQKAIGSSTTAPSTYYSFNIGGEWKCGLGFSATFQGVGGWSGVMNTNGMYRSTVATNTVSQFYYDNCWSAERGNTEYPIFPRLSPTANANNDVTSTINLFGRNYFKLRNIEVFYKLPKSLLSQTGFINGVKIYVRGTDLLTGDFLCEGDAASYGAVQPLSKSLQIGASITF